MRCKTSKKHYQTMPESCVNRAIGKAEDARAGFTTAASDRFNQPKAKKLVTETLAESGE